MTSGIRRAGETSKQDLGLLCRQGEEQTVARPLGLGRPPWERVAPGEQWLRLFPWGSRGQSCVVLEGETLALEGPSCWPRLCC